MRRSTRAIVISASIACLGALAAASAAGAQSRIAGQWVVRYERETNGIHVNSTGVEEARARMTLYQRGDSIVGTWQPIVPAGETPPAPRGLRGERMRDTAVVQLAPASLNPGFFMGIGYAIVAFLKEHVHGILPTTTVVEFTVRGDSLVGTRRSVTADGTVQGRVRPISAVRERP